MARYYKYRRTYSKKVYPRKRWASNIKSNHMILTMQVQGNDSESSADICQNSFEGAIPNPVPVKFGRLKIKGDIRYNNNDVSRITSVVVYAMFVPEGNDANMNLVKNHPEYILGWTCLSLDSGNSFTLTSNLKRILNTGDRISLVVYITAAARPAVELQYSLFYNVQYWTTSA